MTVSQSWAFQQALYARLAAQLAGQGPGGTDVAVFDHVPEDPARLHVRIDADNIVQRPIKCDKTQHFFSVATFDKPTDESGAGRGMKTAKLLQQTIVAALHGWSPGVTGASKVRHEATNPVGEPNGLTSGFTSRFYVHIAPS